MRITLASTSSEHAPDFPDVLESEFIGVYTDKTPYGQNLEGYLVSCICIRIFRITHDNPDYIEAEHLERKGVRVWCLFGREGLAALVDILNFFCTSQNKLA